MGDNDKGKAVQILTHLFKKEYDTVETIGIGDSKNDFSMLKEVNNGYLVKRKDNTYASQDFNHVEGIGPIGWSQVIKKEFID
jgi:mannosyl-3-phosphoglycerate phosphatase